MVGCKPFCMNHFYNILFEQIITICTDCLRRYQEKRYDLFGKYVAIYGIIIIDRYSSLSCLSSSIFREQQDQALAQPYTQTIKYRNLVIDLGNGLKTKAQLTVPAVGKGPFPGVLLVPGSGAR